eukprot:3079995-Rhodomonas_salina.1
MPLPSSNDPDRPVRVCSPVHGALTGPHVAEKPWPVVVKSDVNTTFSTPVGEIMPVVDPSPRLPEMKLVSTPSYPSSVEMLENKSATPCVAPDGAMIHVHSRLLVYGSSPLPSSNVPDGSVR